MFDDVYQTGTDSALADLARRGVNTPAPSARFSTWGTLTAAPRGVTAAGAEAAGSAADVLQGFGAALASTLDSDPIARAAVGRERVEQGAREAREMIDRGEALTSDVGQSFRAAADVYRPDPITAHAAERLVFDFFRAGSKVIAGGLGFGGFGVAGAGFEEALTVADDLREQGVDPATRSMVGAVSGTSLAVGAVLPVAGQTVRGTAALVAAGGPGLFVAQQMATREILEGADYSKLAEGYDPFDPVGLTVSTLIPAAFGAYAVRSARRRATADAEAVDAARVSLAAEQRRAGALADDADLAAQARDDEALRIAEEQLDAGQAVDVSDVAPAVTPRAAQVVGEFAARMQAARPADAVEIPRATDLSPTDRGIEARFAEQIQRDPEAVLAAYEALPDTRGGKIVNTDEARALSPDYNASNRTRALYAAAVHEPASWIAARQYERLLARPPETGQVLILGGGGGSGKTSSLDKIEPGFEDRYDAIYDTTLAGEAKAVRTVEQALATGRTVKITLVARDPFESIVRGVIPRAAKSGRTVPIKVAAKAHEDVPRTLAALVERYANDDRVRFEVVDNTGAPDAAHFVGPGEIPQFQYNQLVGRATQAAREAYEKGAIDEAVLQGLVGRSEAEAAARPRSGEAGSAVAAAGREPAAQRAGSRGPTGASAEVTTERGLSVQVVYRLAEASELVTSHDNALQANPAFPAELQPRDRSRAASEAQIARIENAIDPELLAESRKASDGAPITGPDGVVESGNARTIALRRAYEGGKADGYRRWLAENAERFGLTREQVLTMREPVLVRERTGTLDRAEFARQANESAVAQMSETEQARADAQRLPDLQGLSTTENGTINLAGSAAFVRDFMSKAVGPSERNAMMTADGRLSQRGAARIQNAVFAKAYGDPDLVAMLTESTDANVKNILGGLLRAAPDVARLQELIEAGARQPLQIAPELVAAVRQFSALRDQGMRVDDFLAQGSMFESPVSPVAAGLMQALEANSRAPRRVAELVQGLVREVDALGDPRQAGMFGEVTPDGAALIGKAEQGIAPDQGEAAQPSLLDARMQELEQSDPGALDAEIAVGWNDKGEVTERMRARDYLAEVQRQAAQEKRDAELVRVAAACALRAA
jgi:hypothetical protein